MNALLPHEVRHACCCSGKWPSFLKSKKACQSLRRLRLAQRVANAPASTRMAAIQMPFCSGAE